MTPGHSQVLGRIVIVSSVTNESVEITSLCQCSSNVELLRQYKNNVNKYIFHLNTFDRNIIVIAFDLHTFKFWVQSVWNIDQKELEHLMPFFPN